MASIMEKPPLSSSHLQRDEHDLISLKDWSLKPNKIISRENTKSRRFSASNIRALTEETRSFRSYNATITSTASSPGYILRDAEIDPSSYSFTTALRSLQVKSGYNWEYLSSPDGFALHSKWNEAEKYICNPLSGEVPIECLSAKTLSGRCINRIPITTTTSTTTLKSRITVSGPLIYSSSPHHVHSKPTLTQTEDTFIKSPIQEEKLVMKKDLIRMSSSSSTRDVGTQSTPPYMSSSSPSPTSTPSIKERSLVRALRGDDDESPKSGSKSKNLEKEEIEGKEKTEKEEATKKGDVKKKDRQMWKWFKPFEGCCCCCCLLPWMTNNTSLWMRKRQQRGKNTSQVNFESTLE